MYHGLSAGHTNQNTLTSDGQPGLFRNPLKRDSAIFSIMRGDGNWATDGSTNVRLYWGYQTFNYDFDGASMGLLDWQFLTSIGGPSSAGRRAHVFGPSISSSFVLSGVDTLDFRNISSVYTVRADLRDEFSQFQYPDNTYDHFSFYNDPSAQYGVETYVTLAPGNAARDVYAPDSPAIVFPNRYPNRVFLNPSHFTVYAAGAFGRSSGSQADRVSGFTPGLHKLNIDPEDRQLPPLLLPSTATPVALKDPRDGSTITCGLEASANGTIFYVPTPDGDFEQTIFEGLQPGDFSAADFELTPGFNPVKALDSSTGSSGPNGNTGGDTAQCRLPQQSATPSSPTPSWLNEDWQKALFGSGVSLVVIAAIILAVRACKKRLAERRDASQQQPAANTAAETKSAETKSPARAIQMTKTAQQRQVQFATPADVTVDVANVTFHAD
jgi:hypothetical protein